VSPKSTDETQESASSANGPAVTARNASHDRFRLAERAWDAFQRAYDQLLEQHSGQWVAFHGEQQIGFAPTRAELVLECRKRGLHDDECVIGQILPVIEETPIGLPGFQEDVDVGPGVR
jgi:hypothetical protein